jgi:hypothetical protein
MRAPSSGTKEEFMPNKPVFTSTNLASSVRSST